MSDEGNDQELIDAARRQFIEPDNLTWLVERSPVASIVVNEKFLIENATTGSFFSAKSQKFPLA